MIYFVDGVLTTYFYDDEKEPEILSVSKIFPDYKRVFDEDGRVKYTGKIYVFSKNSFSIDGDNNVKYQTITVNNDICRVLKFKHFYCDNAFHHTEIEVI